MSNCTALVIREVTAATSEATSERSRPISQFQRMASCCFPKVRLGCDDTRLTIKSNIVSSVTIVAVQRSNTPGRIENRHAMLHTYDSSPEPSDEDIGEPSRTVG